MQGNRGNRDPFSAFNGLLGGFGGQRSLFPSMFGGDPLGGGQGSMFPSLFGGRDPFDDPFFSRPFGSMFESSTFGSVGNPLAGMPFSGFIEHQAPQPNNSRGPIIEELHSDDEGETVAEEKMDNPRKHRRPNKEPSVEDPDDAVEERRSKHLQYSTANNRVGSRSRPQTHSYTFQSSTMTYGGGNGAYYTSSTTRRSGSDGLIVEESKEANSSTGQARHRISRGVHEKGHTLTRKLDADGRVEKMQTLHNLNEDQLAGFEDTWNMKAKKCLPGWSEKFSAVEGSNVAGQSGLLTARGSLALPSTEQSFTQTSSQPRAHPYSHPNADPYAQPVRRMNRGAGSPHLHSSQ